MRWGRGAANVDEEAAAAEEEARVMAAPLARAADDAHLNRQLKEELHVEDPMYEYMMKQKAKKHATSGAKAKPRYTGPPPPPNRFGIAPGHRWDGRDRSGGFEKQWFLVQNQRHAKSRDAYKWSSEAM